MTNQVSSPKRFHVVLIKPSKYDDEGYIVRWWRGIITSNSLACLYGLTRDLQEREVLGPDVEIVPHCYDETVQRIPVRRLVKEILNTGERGIVAFVGIQTNQFARAADLAREFRKHGLPSMIGGFHVSGTMAMLPDLPSELKQAQEEGVTLVAGEVENHWGELLKAAYEDRLKPVYNFLAAKPDLRGAPLPVLLKENLNYFISAHSSIDTGRGCPFKCSFCTIINVQGNEMRGRSAEDIEKLVRFNYSQGLKHIFFTDDNFARHKDWEKIADRLIEMKEKEKMGFVLQIQTDMMAHKIPGFIEKISRAGCRRVFLGLESVNAANLKASSKHQNQIKEYRVSLQKWHDHDVLTYAGYILGFPDDTYESIVEDIEFLKRELPLDFPEFFVMTPLPGSADHQKLCRDKIPLEPDTNCYDGMHVCTKHPRMSDEELTRAYQYAWKSFYSFSHLSTVLKRLKSRGLRRRALASMIWFCSSFFQEKMHPLLGGMIRIKGRKSRRPEFPRENIFIYYPKRAVELVVSVLGLGVWALSLYLLKLEAEKPKNADYKDAAITTNDE